jgi:hypothetical protein
MWRCICARSSNNDLVGRGESDEAAAVKPAYNEDGPALDRKRVFAVVPSASRGCRRQSCGVHAQHFQCSGVAPWKYSMMAAVSSRAIGLTSMPISLSHSASATSLNPQLCYRYQSQTSDSDPCNPIARYQKCRKASLPTNSTARADTMRAAQRHEDR